jgi:septal ring-binding cell division protein DamX
LQSGKVSFMSGNFKPAFHELLPLAAEGIPQAEYGVGYMYYYGYGVTQDTESGIFWMNKAAAAHYAPAIRALAAIQENTLKQENASPRSSASLPATKAFTENGSSEKNAASLPQQGHVTVMPQNNETAFAKPNRYNTVSASSTGFVPSKYTLQLLGSYSLPYVKQQQVRLNLGVPTRIGQTKHNGLDWYVLTYGEYPGLGNAELAKLDLPKKIKDLKPWSRKCDELKWVAW